MKCPCCGSHDVHTSRFRYAGDVFVFLLGILLFRPFRCLACERRFWRPWAWPLFRQLTRSHPDG